MSIQQPISYLAKAPNWTLATILANQILILLILLGPALYLTIGLIVLSCIIGNMAAAKWENGYKYNLSLLHWIVIVAFLTHSMFWFYYAFEVLLLPIYFTVYYYGQSEDKIRTAYKFIYYALSTSLLWLITILNYYNYSLSLSINDTLLGVAFLIPLLVKLPMPPLHIWLNDTHTASPVSGSILLAGSILKLSIFGLIAYYIPNYPITYQFISILLLSSTIPSTIFAALSCIRQVDYKRLIAYTSVAHMNVALFAVLVSTDSVQGSIIMLIGHGLISASLFYHVNSLYERYHTKLLLYLRGITFIMPIGSMIGLIYNLSNFAFPPSINWLAEYIIFSFSISNYPIATILIGASIIIGILYSLWTYFRVYFGSCSKYLIRGSDLSYSETITLITIFLYIIFSTYFITTF